MQTQLLAASAMIAVVILTGCISNFLLYKQCLCFFYCYKVIRVPALLMLIGEGLTTVLFALFFNLTPYTGNSHYWIMYHNIINSVEKNIFDLHKELLD